MTHTFLMNFTYNSERFSNVNPISGYLNPMLNTLFNICKQIYHKMSTPLGNNIHVRNLQKWVRDVRKQDDEYELLEGAELC